MEYLTIIIILIASNFGCMVYMILETKAKRIAFKNIKEGISELEKKFETTADVSNKGYKKLSSLAQNGKLEKSEVLKIKTLISSKDYYAIIHLAKKYPNYDEIRNEVYKVLKEDYEGSKDVTLKREVLKLLDELTDRFLENSSYEDFNKIKEMKIQVEELYKDLNIYLQSEERRITQNKISILESNINRIDKIKDFGKLDDIVTEINEVDSSINKSFLNINDDLKKKYEMLLSSLSLKIKKRESSILYRQNMSALRMADFLRKKFNNDKKIFSDFDEVLIERFVNHTDYNKYEKLLPDTLQYCEQAKQEIVGKLSPDQYKVYAKKVVEREFISG